MAELTRKEVVLILAGVPDVTCRRSEHRVRLAGVDLSGLDLRGLNFAHADLAGADMRGCDLSDARLFEADLSSADLTDAVLCGVYADGATFVAATLIRADFRRSRRDLFYGTHLIGADFQGADLTHSRFDEARRGARFDDSALEATRADDEPASRGAQSDGQLPAQGPTTATGRPAPTSLFPPRCSLEIATFPLGKSSAATSVAASTEAA